MDHPLIQEENSDLRRRVIQLFQDSYSVFRTSNILFVCGGNADLDMRPRFRDYCARDAEDFVIFFPEFAMADYFSSPTPVPFDLADFEQLVGQLSHAIVIFPEAPGSFAETGYFSAVPSLAGGIILALDVRWQGQDSFISMGPAKKIAAKSIFQPNIQIDYRNPTFSDIVTRSRSRGVAKNKKVLKIEKFSEQSVYELFCIIYKVVEILSVATIGDILYILTSIYRGHISKTKVRNIASILVGSGYVASIGKYGHYSTLNNKKDLLEIRDGHVTRESEVLLALAAIYQDGDPEFLSIVEGSR